MAVAEENGEQLWQSILADVMAHTTTRRLPPKQIILLGTARGRGRWVRRVLARGQPPRTAGDEGSGKSSLVARLQERKFNADEHPMSSGLEFSYLDVKDDDSEGGLGGRARRAARPPFPLTRQCAVRSADIISRMGVYTLCGGTDHALLLDHVLTADTLDSTVAAICVDLTRPWAALAAIKRCAPLALMPACPQAMRGAG